MSQRECILVLDDEPTLRRLVERFLETRGFRVEGAGDGQEALALLDELPVDLVLTDIHMPGVSGHDLVAEIHRRWPAMPILVMTGFPQVDDAVHLMRSGIVDYLRKPLDMERLEMVIRGALAKVPKPPPPVVDHSLEATMPIRGLVDHYRIVKTLGKGSMGIVYLVDRPADDDGRCYALKILDPGPDDEQNRIMRERLLREGAIARQLHHPGLVELLDIGVTTDRQIPYIVMEYVEGRTVEALIASGSSLTYREKAAILRQVAEALAVIHARNLCHRDIKPGNILVDDVLHAKLMDLGLARIPNSDLTGAYNVVGTPAYMAPEAYRTGQVDARSDLFSLGVVAYELLLGHRPFDSLVLANLVLQIERLRPMEPRRHDPALPLPLQLILAKLLKKDPAERYQDAAAVAADLGSFLHGKSTWPERLRHRVAHFRANDWR